MSEEVDVMVSVRLSDVREHGNSEAVILALLRAIYQSCPAKDVEGYIPLALGNLDKLLGTTHTTRLRLMRKLQKLHLIETKKKGMPARMVLRIPLPKK